jgi:hypothetical protein
MFGFRHNILSFKMSPPLLSGETLYFRENITLTFVNSRLNALGVR